MKIQYGKLHKITGGLIKLLTKSTKQHTDKTDKIVLLSLNGTFPVFWLNFELNLILLRYDS